MNQKIWFGPAYLIEGFMFATGCFTKNFTLTTGATIGAIATTIADIHARRRAVRDARADAIID